MPAVAHAQAPAGREKGVGPLLSYWRRTRQKSQLALASEAGVSPRHLCFLETGRARPSREMVLHLAQALAVPLRERNTLLLAAGFAPLFAESSLDDPQLAAVKMALTAILEQQEPYPAVAMNRAWDIVRTNAAAARFFALLAGKEPPPGAPNVLRSMFHPRGLRPHVANWEAVAETLIQRLHREAVGGVLDEAARGVLSEILAYPGVPARWRAPDLTRPQLPVVPVCFRHGGRAYNFFSTVTVLGTPQDVTLQELRIECFFPADEATRLLLSG
jgi:transcriptional regulator with XRE-family HTH domain